jgi:dUTP pyrophosphatase
MDKENLTKEDIHSISESLAGVISGEDNIDMAEALIRLLAMDDDQFDVLAPGVMQAYQQSINNPNDKLMMVQSLNANGSSAEDLIAFFEDFQKQIEGLPLSIKKRDFLSELVASTINSINETEGISKRTINVPIELCHPNAVIPQYAHISDSGMDVYALEDITINPGETVLVPTGIKVALPPGYELQVRPKSGRCVKTKLRVANTPGTIDQGYRDEIKIIIENVDPPIRRINPLNWPTDELNPVIHWSDIEFGQSYTIGKGEKFAQLVLAETPKVSFYRVDSVADIGEDRGGGFGSTGLV